MTISIALFISSRDTHAVYLPEGPRVDKVRGLIYGMILKVSYHNIFIIHLFIFRKVNLVHIL